MHKPLILSAALFAIVAVSALGIAFVYSPFLERSISDHDTALQNIGDYSIDSQRSLVNFYSQLNNIDTVLDKRTTISGISSLLSSGIHKDVSIEDADLSVKDKELSLNGYALSTSVFSEQVEALQRHNDVKAVAVKNSESVDGSITFTILLSLYDEIFQ